MEAVVAEHPGIGRVKLEKLAGVSQLEARVFLANKRSNQPVEFAANNNFSFSKPTQSFWLTDPEHGRTLRAPIHVTSKDENWESCVDKTEVDWLSGIGV